MSGEWSDGVQRSVNYEGSPLHLELRKYFEDKLEEELIGLRWENEWLRQQLKEKQSKALAVSV